MKFTLFTVTALAWALWMGATIAVFVFVKHFFAVFPHDQAAEAANAMFHAFANYELVLAGIAVIGSGLLLISYPSKSYVLLLGTTILAASMVITVAMGLMPAMDSLRAEGRHDEYMKLHGKSMMAMVMQSAILLVEGGVLLASLGPGSITTPAQVEDEGRRANGRSMLDTTAKTARA